MARRIVYSNGSTRIAIAKMEVFDKVTPFWVYYNDKLVTKFADKDTAQKYAMVLFNG